MDDKEFLSNISGRISRGLDVDEVYPTFNIRTLPDLRPEAIGANVNGLYYTRAQYERLRQSCKVADTGSAWSQDWPTEPGWYWFWGVDYRQYGDIRPITDGDRRLIMVHVTVRPWGVTCWGDGHRLHKMIERPANGGAVGVWQRAITPDLPVTDGKQTP